MKRQNWFSLEFENEQNINDLKKKNKQKGRKRSEKEWKKLIAQTVERSLRAFIVVVATDAQRNKR